MLTVTTGAVALLKAAKAANGAPEQAGIRIRRGSKSDDPEALAIGVTISDELGPGDQEFEQEGLRIFVEDALVEPLDGLTLDIREASEGPELIFR